MSVTRTFTVTVSNPGSGNKYFIDGVQQDTINLAEGGTYVFNYPSAHPFKFSTTSDGTHNSGSEYTTGVTVNSSTQVQITVAASAPQLYYYCQYHSGMGGQANTVDPNTWGVFAWNDGEWGQQNDQTITLTGLSATSSVGEVISGANQGWGRAEWGEEPWGESNNPVITLTGNGLTSAIGAVTIQDEINTGWGQDGWGVENWGESALTVVVDVESSGVATTELPDTSWGAQGWGSSSDAGDVGITWGGDFILNVADAMGLTGLSATSAIGSPTIILSPTVTLSAPSNLTSNVGAISIDDVVIGLSGLGSTSAVGSITPADVVGISSAGVLTTAVGEIVIDETLIVSISGVGATLSVGSVITEVAYTLTAPTNLTSGVGAIAPADVVGLEGLEATISVGNLSPLGYKDIDITGNTSYTDVVTTRAYRRKNYGINLYGSRSRINGNWRKRWYMGNKN